MIFDFSVTAIVLVSLFIVLQLGNANLHEQAEIVIKGASALTAFLLASRFILSNKRKYGWQTYTLALVPVCVYILLAFVLNGTGGIGACD